MLAHGFLPCHIEAQIFTWVYFVGACIPLAFVWVRDIGVRFMHALTYMRSYFLM